MARELIASDGFNRANEDPIAGNWVSLNDNSSRIELDTNVIKATHSQSAAARWVGTGTFTDDQYSSLEIGGLGNFSSKIGVIVRASGGLNTARDYYDGRITDSSPKVTALFKTVDGTETQLDSRSDISWVNGDILSVEVEGTAIRLYVNDDPNPFLEVTDSALTTGKPGVFGANAGTQISGDNWEGGNVVAGAPGGGGEDSINRGIFVLP